MCSPVSLCRVMVWKQHRERTWQCRVSIPGVPQVMLGPWSRAGCAVCSALPPCSLNYEWSLWFFLSALVFLETASFPSRNVRCVSEGAALKCLGASLQAVLAPSLAGMWCSHTKCFYMFHTGLMFNIRVSYLFSALVLKFNLPLSVHGCDAVLSPYPLTTPALGILSCRN